MGTGPREKITKTPKTYRPRDPLFWVWEKTLEEEEEELRPTRPSLFKPYAPETRGKLTTRSRAITARNAKLAREIANARLVQKFPELEYELEEGEIYEPPAPLPAYTGPLSCSQKDLDAVELERRLNPKTVTPRRHTRIRRNHRKRTQEELAKKYRITLSE